MAGYIYCNPFKYGEKYPPVNADSITQIVSDWHTLPAGTQIRSRIQADEHIYADDFCYGFIVSNSNTPTLTLKINGEVKGEIKNTLVQPLEANTTIFGYSVTPSYVDLWTRSDYRDKSAEVMYGRRDLRVELATFNDWDVAYPGSGRTIRRCLLHGINDNALNIYKETVTDGGSSYYIGIDFSGNIHRDSAIATPFRGILLSKVISTLELESVVDAIQSQLENIEKQVQTIQTEVDRIIPDLTTKINYETSRLYSSR